MDMSSTSDVRQWFASRGYRTSNNDDLVDDLVCQKIMQTYEHADRIVEVSRKGKRSSFFGVFFLCLVSFLAGSVL